MLVYLLKLLAQCGNFKGESSTLARQGGGEVKGWERGWGRERERGGGGQSYLNTGHFRAEHFQESDNMWHDYTLTQSVSVLVQMISYKPFNIVCLFVCLFVCFSAQQGWPKQPWKRLMDLTCMVGRLVFSVHLCLGGHECVCVHVLGLDGSNSMAVKRGQTQHNVAGISVFCMDYSAFEVNPKMYRVCCLWTCFREHLHLSYMLILMHTTETTQSCTPFCLWLPRPR